MFLPENIDLGQSEKYVLTIRIKPDRFTFSISEPTSKKTFCLRETSFSAGTCFKENIQKTIFDLNFLTQQFQKTNVIIVSKDYELVPAGYYNSKEKETLFRYTNTEDEGYISASLLDKQDIVTLFSIDKEIFEFLSRNLWAPQFHIHSNLLINFFENRARNEHNNRMHLYFHEGLLDIICYSGDKLIHCLTYEKETIANQLYFILKLWEKCNFDQIKDHLYISGKPETIITSRLADYIKNIDSIDIPSEVYLWAEDAQNAPLDLLSLIL